MAIKGANRRLGFWGERKAVKYLKKKGYKIVERNFKCKTGEVDIIALDGEYMAFIEVKTRSNDNFGAPNEAVDRERKQRYKNTAKLYMYINGIRQEDYIVRFDVIEVTKEGINHIENAF
ncbi:MAG: YraN family protein [Candidatus Coproplasma sp.]